MRQVWRELQGENGVVQTEHVANSTTNRCVSGQLEEATMVLAQVQFTCRAQHALAFDAPQMARLDSQSLAVGAGRQFGAVQGAGHFDAGACVRRSANDVEQRPLSS